MEKTIVVNVTPTVDASKLSEALKMAEELGKKISEAKTLASELASLTKDMKLVVDVI